MNDSDDLDRQVVQWLAGQGVEAYLVGGYVRDRLLDRRSYDVDVAVPADAMLLARRLAGHFRGAYYALDELRDTGRAILSAADGSHLVVDVARFRGPGLAADLADRDFTINALAADVHTPGDVIDLFDGRRDLDARLIRAVSPHSIRDDPIRALRAIRQAAGLSFLLSPGTEDLLTRDGAGLLGEPGERIRDEMARLLELANAAPFLLRMDDLGLLTVVFPELVPLRGVAQPPPHHLDVLSHSLETVRALEDLLAHLIPAGDRPEPAGRVQAEVTGGRNHDTGRLAHLDVLAPFAGRIADHVQAKLGEVRPRLVTLKLAALLHDAGKPAARTLDDDGRIRFLGHERAGTGTAGDALRRLRFNHSEVRLGETIVRNHMRPLLLANQDQVSARAVYRFFRETDAAGVDVLLHSLADHLATYAPTGAQSEWRRLVALVARMLADYWEQAGERVAPPTLLDGNEILREFKLQPGPRIGELLEAVREAQVSGEVLSRDQALGLIGRHLSERAGL